MAEETVIYIKLIDGVECLVPVKARQITEETFLITENDDWDDEDFSSVWEFFPGDVVRVIKKDGHLEVDSPIEYSKSVSERKLRDLVFLIVKSLGKIPLANLTDMKAEVTALCKENKLHQQKHPLVKSWIANNCKDL